MNNLVNQLSAFSILLPFLAGLIRFNKINRSYYPFLLLIFLGVVNEVVSIISISYVGNSVIPINIYCLFAALLIVWQFEKWQLFNSKLSRRIMLVFLAVWLIEVIFIAGTDRFCSYFIILTSFIITLLSIFMINRLIISERRNLVKNSMFIISVGFVIFFAYSLLVECLIMNSSATYFLFRVRIFQIFDITNLFTNLLYTLAIIWMPTRLRFTLPY